MSDLNTFLSKAVQDLGPVGEHAGGSGYFNKPDPTLDPRLFNGATLRPEVRDWILNTFYGYWSTKYHSAKDWSTVWLAGSGISYQWSGDRSNGDLDILIGVDLPKFFDNNMDYVGISETELADLWNRDLKENLWPKTESTVFTSPEGFSGSYEATFFVNPGSEDIRDIHPYAAYDVTHNRWTVKPPVLPQNPESLYPREWWDYVNSEKEQADGLVARYNTLFNALKGTHPSSPGWQNALSAMGLVLDQSRALFDDIHLGRRKAFGPGGSGYGDLFNFRWQAHKRLGTMQALASLAGARREAHDAEETALYGHPLATAEQALTQAALWNRGVR